MVGLAVLTVLSLLWMARWVHKRGRFGSRTNATLRSLSPIVLGLGGWFLGTLIVLTIMSGVSLDNALIGTLSVGVPIGLGVYFAWMDRDWSAKTRTTGFAAAMGGALIGAWLGFNATTGFLVIVTAIVGAAVCANLILLAIDIAWDRSNRSRFAAVGVPPAPMQPTKTHAGWNSHRRRLTGRRHPAGNNQLSRLGEALAIPARADTPKICRLTPPSRAEAYRRSTKKRGRQPQLKGKKWRNLVAVAITRRPIDLQCRIEAKS